MKVFITKNKNQGDKKAFQLIKKQVLKKPDSLFGLAVGSTIDSLYKLISKDVVKNPNQWLKVKLFQIDENLGIPIDSPLSFNHEIKRELKRLLKIVKPKNIFLIGREENPKKIIKKAYKFIKKNKGIDLIILGIGPEYDPHIAYNTTGKSSINSRMRVIELHPKIVEKLTKKCHPEGAKRPKDLITSGDPSSLSLLRMTPYGVTLGIKDILECKKVLLIAYGKDKAKSIKLAFSGKVNMKRASASALQLHKDLYVVINRDAAMLLRGAKRRSNPDRL